MSSSGEIEINENESENPIFYNLAIEKLKQRFPVDEMNFFDEKNDFNIDVSTIMLSDQIAKGSYGVVYHGVMRREKYAVKVEDLRTGVEEQVNILSELTILQSFPHHCLVKFFGTGYLSKSLSEAKVHSSFLAFVSSILTSALQVMIVMELCENGALREKIQEDLPWNLIVRLALDIATGLSFLHENNIVHRFPPSFRSLSSDEVVLQRRQDHEHLS
jgi:serine/threonine protein kinase